MSLLFDALKRAQGNKPDIRTQVAGRPKINLLPYATAALILLAGGFSWFIYQQTKYVPISTQNPVAFIQPPAASAVAAASSVAPASDVAAASGMAQTIAALPATASGAPEKKPWTHPATPKKHHKRIVNRPAMIAAIDPLNEAYMALSRGQLDLAEQKYQAVLAQYPHEKDALLGLAVIAQRKLQTDRATELYRQVLREDIGNAAAAAGLVSLSAQADPVAAESQLRELLDIKPAAPELHYALGGVLARQLRWGEAQESFYRAYSLAPGNALYAYNLAVALDRLHQTAAAISYYEKASSLSKQDNPTLNMNAIAQRIAELKHAETRY